MKLPTLSAHSVSRDMISTFGGYHHHSTVPDNSFFDMKNLSADHYPALSVRRARGIFKDGEVTLTSAMIYTDRLCYVDRSALVIGTERIECGLSTYPSMMPKKLVSMGTYIIVFPDHYYVNTAKTSDRGKLERRYTYQRGEGVTDIYRCDENGKTTDSSGQNLTFSDYFCIINSPLASAGFQRGDRIRVETVTTNPEFTDTGVIPKLIQAGTNMYAVECYYTDSDPVVYSVLTDRVIFKGALRSRRSTTAGINSKNDDYAYGYTFSTSIFPEMDFVFEHENRLWGCRYGINALGEMVNEIYASALGSFREWHLSEGTAKDAFWQGVGTDGPFTGACSLNGYPIFFKEKCYHKVYGSYPGQYRVQAVECKGIQQGSSDSMATINGVLYYKAVDAVCSFDGSYPTDISYSLGDRRYEKAVGGSHRYKYYLSMRDIDTGEWSLFVYDARYGLWHKEDELRAVCFCDTMRALYCIPAAGDCILDVTGGDADGETVIPWSFETGMITSETVDRKFLRDISVRLSLAVGGVLFAFIEYDSSGRWEYLFRIPGTSTNTFTIPITPQRCDHFRLKFSGTGDMKLFALAKSYTKGSAY